MSIFVIILISIFICYQLKKPLFLSKLKNIFLITLICFLIISIIKHPQHAFDAAKIGIDTWFNIVFPALLPFFIGAELLIGLGVVQFIGVLLEPIVRPIFNVPGEGSFVLAMSITSGYPVGVKLASNLRSQGVFNKFEAQRLISFCSTSGPLFMIGAVSVGMFHNLQLGTVIAISHYLGAIVTGVIFRFYGYKYKSSNRHIVKSSYFKKAFHEMAKTIKNNNKPFGSLLGESVKNSMESLLSIGGFIILFSVIIHLLTLMGIIHVISNFIQHLLFAFALDNATCNAITSSIFEMTIGCKLLSEIEGISFIKQAILASMMISWSGFSIHAQAASLISKSDLSTGIYIFSKLLHSIFSGIFVLFTLPITYLVFRHLNTPVFADHSVSIISPTWIEKILFSSELFFMITLFIFTIAILLQTLYYGIVTFSNNQKK